MTFRLIIHRLCLLIMLHERIVSGHSFRFLRLLLRIGAATEPRPDGIGNMSGALLYGGHGFVSGALLSVAVMLCHVPDLLLCPICRMDGAALGQILRRRRDSLFYDGFDGLFFSDFFGDSVTSLDCPLAGR